MKLTWDEQVLIDLYRKNDDKGKASMIETGHICLDIKHNVTHLHMEYHETERAINTYSIIRRVSEKS